jgi:hypothetical protein
LVQPHGPNNANSDFLQPVEWLFLHIPAAGNAPLVVCNCVGPARGAVGGRMVRQFLFGGVICAVNIAMHALVMAAVVQAAQFAAGKVTARSSAFLVGVMIVTVSVLMVAHALQVLVWALGYMLVDAVPAGASRVYFAFVNYTTLGYGDIIPTDDWKLLGPMTAMNGVLLFGWSTAVIFEVLRRAMTRASQPGWPQGV